MLRLLLSGLLLVASLLHAQSERLTVPVDGATTLVLSSHFAKVEVTTGSGPDIELDHRITINGKPRPEYSDVTVTREGQQLRITERGPREAELKKAMTPATALIDGREVRGYEDHNIDIHLQVKVPPGVTVFVETHYGGADVRDVSGLQSVKSTYGTITVVYREADRADDLVLYSNYGEVDLALPAGAPADVELVTEHGSLLTDFDIAIDASASEHRNFFERIQGSINGGGPRVQCRSPYNTIYLRVAR